MSAPTRCPRCSTECLSVVYYGADDQLIGGLTQCPECGPRHAVRIEAADIAEAAPVRDQLLKRKAS
jgi:transcription elongation factor Elf1